MLSRSFIGPDDVEYCTKNYMIVLYISSNSTNEGSMSEKGRVQIGKPNERIMSIHFFDNITYAVTFQQTDPFYVLDMSIPKVLGGLFIPGFSSYLHPMNSNNSMLGAVGQDATSSRQATGLMVTIFDATDKTNPMALVSQTFDDGSSSAQ